MCSKLPIVSLPNCDVSNICGKQFTVETLSEYFSRVCSLIEDKAFYSHQSEVAWETGKALTDPKPIMKNLFEKLQLEVTKDE